MNGNESCSQPSSITDEETDNEYEDDVATEARDSVRHVVESAVGNLESQRSKRSGREHHEHLLTAREASVLTDKDVSAVDVGGASGNSEEAQMHEKGIDTDGGDHAEKDATYVDESASPRRSESSHGEMEQEHDEDQLEEASLHSGNENDEYNDSKNGARDGEFNWL